MIDNHRIVPMIKPIFHLSHEQNKVLFVSSMIHFQPSFRKPPKVFNRVDMSCSSSKGLLMSNTDMMEPFKVESVIRSEAVRVNPGMWLHMCFNCSLKCLLVNLLRKYYPDLSIPASKAQIPGFSHLHLCLVFPS